MTGTYTITLANCAFFARHGVMDEEEVLGQRFFVDAELEVMPAGPLEHDALETTVDYGVAFKLIEKIVTGRRYYLIEALATEIARALAQQFPQIVRAKITLRKPNAPISGVLDYVQVSVEHHAQR
ncbi:MULTISPECIES: dihydroneopterin aldolase [unclassified Rhizobium]|jgi:dihydroneopterin aldolase|uniref:dihydroneopterin aldolase n=1 Tax=unclassified Rhizobium TaxID=2613769 RepID=UPI001602CD8F|nr:MULTISPECIES: dihydroneopterin aldolase [unclassified Rhizobium]MBB1247556.1 dihydroneopterin aldolase [Rhizobium sp. G21]MCV3764183.1 dihydroneopterin aldolase [Rhizobium sp. TRM95796]